MTQSIYVTATQRGSGKSTIALGMVSLLERSLGRVGFFKPIGHYTNGSDTDPDVELMRETFGLKAVDTQPIPMTRVAAAVANNTLDDVIDEILDAYARVSADCDFVVCEGTDYFGAMASLEFDINARVAKDLGAPILLVAGPTDAHGEQAGAPSLLDQVRTVKESFDDKEVDFFGVILNRVDPQLHAELKRTAAAALASHDVRVLGVVPRADMLEKPRLDEIAAAIGAEVISGHERMNVVAQRVLVGAMSLEHALERTLINQPHGVLLVVPGDREDLLLGLAAAYVSNAAPPPAGVVMTGGFEPGPIVKQLILDITEGRMPLMKVALGTYETTLAVTAVRPKLLATQRTRIDIAKGLVERHVNVDPLVTRGAVGTVGKPSRLTPKQFLHRVIHLARSDRKHIVLPEGHEARIQRAAERLLARKVVDLTLLGNEDEIRSCSARLGLKLDGVQILDPTKTEHRESFATRYVELRPVSKRPTFDAAMEIMSDPTFFGTMMVHEGLAHGMVSGSINTTAHTLRPALQFIKTREDVSIASSVFFMCLPSSVLVYGDCAVNPNPTAEQLADIALASARTAQAFEIEPFVAMLSYSTGDSGAGSDVERVREATRIVRERNPELPVEGPIQYDAAVDPTVAKTKLPNSRVAGAATVFIFPDLNAGNNTYKAVQRSAGAIAVGPVMQGLRKPVNDLSRGCTVDDIVNTVAITAIQAQRG